MPRPLPPTTVHRLAQKSVPVKVVDTVVSQAKAGKIVPDTAVVEMLAEAKFQQRQAGHTGRQGAHAKRRKRHRREVERHEAEYEAQRDRELQAARDAALRLMGGLGAAGVALLLGELDRALNKFAVIDELRKAVDLAADNQHCPESSS
jgi:hypothetical protein